MDDGGDGCNGTAGGRYRRMKVFRISVERKKNYPINSIVQWLKWFERTNSITEMYCVPLKLWYSSECVCFCYTTWISFPLFKSLLSKNNFFFFITWVRLKWKLQNPIHSTANPHSLRFFQAKAVFFSPFSKIPQPI